MEDTEVGFIIYYNFYNYLYLFAGAAANSTLVNQYWERPVWREMLAKQWTPRPWLCPHSSYSAAHEFKFLICLSACYIYHDAKRNSAKYKGRRERKQHKRKKNQESQ